MLKHLIKLVYSYATGKEVCNYPPFVWMIEPTNSCNLSCRMCAHSRMTRPTGFMDIELFRDIIDHNRSNISQIRLFMVGEPLMHKRIVEMVSYAKNNQIAVHINTNATIMDENISQGLLAAGLDSISFSFEGFNKEHYESLRQNAVYETTLNNIKEFINLKKEKGYKKPMTIIEIIDTGIKNIEKKKARKYFSELGINVDAVDIVPLYGWPDGNKDYIRKPNADSSKKNKLYKCFLPWAMVGILYNGDVVNCCDNFNGEYVLGNVKDNIDVMTFWNNDKSRALRKNIKAKAYSSIDLCRNCFRQNESTVVFPSKRYLKHRIIALLKGIR